MKVKKKILFTVAIPGFHFNDAHSSIGPFFKEISQSIKDLGYEVDYFPEKEEPKYSKWIKSLFVRSISKVFPIVKDWFYVSAVRQMEKDALHKYKPDLIFDFSVRCGQMGYAFKKKYSIPSIVLYDNPIEDEMNYFYNSSDYFIDQIRISESLNTSTAQCISFYSKSVSDYLESRVDIAADKIYVPCINWRNIEGVKEQEIPSNNNSPLVFGFMGSFLKWHRVDMLIRCFSEVYKVNPNCELILLGRGQTWHQNRKLVTELNLDDVVSMPGFVSGTDLVKEMAKIHVGIMPGSNWYGSPLKLFEYAARGMVIVAPHTPTIDYLFKDFKSFLWIDEENPEIALTDVFIRISNDRSFCGEIGSQNLKNFNAKYNKTNHFSPFQNSVTKLLKV